MSLLRLSVVPPSVSVRLCPPPLRRPTTTPSALRLRISAAYNPTPYTDRLISAASYTLPLLNGVSYGRFLLSQSPSLSSLFSPLLPLLSLYRSVPYASFLAFFALYLAVARNPSLSRFARFNAMQALMLDVGLVLPQLLIRIVGNPGRPGGIVYKLMVMGHNAVFVFIVMCFIYSFVCSVLGKTPYLPLVADAAGRQMP